MGVGGERMMAALKSRTLVVSSELSAVFSRMVDEAINRGYEVVACYGIRDMHCALIMMNGYAGDIDGEYESLLDAVIQIERDAY